MSQDNITYLVATGVAYDAATGWISYLPEPSLPNAVYLATLLWIGIQIWFKLKGK